MRSWEKAEPTRSAFRTWRRFQRHEHQRGLLLRFHPRPRQDPDQRSRLRLEHAVAGQLRLGMEPRRHHRRTHVLYSTASAYALSMLTEPARMRRSCWPSSTASRPSPPTTSPSTERRGGRRSGFAVDTLLRLLVGGPCTGRRTGQASAPLGMRPEVEGIAVRAHRLATRCTDASRVRQGRFRPWLIDVYIGETGGLLSRLLAWGNHNQRDWPRHAASAKGRACVDETRVWVAGEPADLQSFGEALAFLSCRGEAKGKPLSVRRVHNPLSRAMPCGL